MKKDIIEIYKDFVSNNFINYDDNQSNFLNNIQKTYLDSKKINFFINKNLFYGIYVHGSVGIGKTFVMNLFIQNNPKAKKIHFNHFMINLHAFINNSKANNALELYVKNFSKDCKLLFIDELHIFNIVDALLVKKIFNFFKRYKIFILISSNFKPSNLYKNGLQRSDFLPFINFIELNFKIFHLKNIIDYRRQMLNQSKTYFTPINPITSNEFEKLFKRFVDKSEIYIKKINSNSRVIRFEKATANIAFCSFDELCNVNLGSEDYYNISKNFNLIFLNKVPCLSDNELDQCRRFISLIDMLYENKCSIVILAEKPINTLCSINNLKEEFKRTASRLYEMTIIDSNFK